MAEGALGNRLVKDGAPVEGVDLVAFREELERARRHVERLERQYRHVVELDRRARGAAPRLDEDPRFARACNAALWAVVALPVVLGIVLILKRLIG